MYKTIVLLALSFMLYACASVWSAPEDHPVTIKVGDIGLEMPTRWMTLNDPNDKYRMLETDNKYIKVERAVLSKDGLSLNAILITRFDMTQVFPNISHLALDKTAPQQWAEMYVAEIMRAESLDGLKVIKSEPVTVLGKKGFALRCTYSNSAGLMYSERAYGIEFDHGFYVFRFIAPDLYYFGRDLPEFEKMIASVRKSHA